MGPRRSGFNEPEGVCGQRGGAESGLGPALPGTGFARLVPDDLAHRVSLTEVGTLPTLHS